MNERIAAVRKVLARKNVSCLLVSSEPNVRWLTGQYDLGAVIVIPAAAEPFVVTSVMEKERAVLSGLETFSGATKIAADIKAKTFLTAIKKVLRKKKLKTKVIGIEKGFISADRFEKTQKAFPGCRFVNVSRDMLNIRAIKTAGEIRALRAAARLSVRAMRAVSEALMQGVTERQLAALAEAEMRKAADWYSFRTIVASGPNAALPHHTTSDRKIGRADFVIVDCGAIVDGYCSDMSRTFCLNPEKGAKEIYKTALTAHSAVLVKIKPGVKAKVLHGTAQKIINKAGFELVHGVGHGVGVEIYEEPSLHGDSKSVLKPGMVFTIEPGLYFAGWGGVRIEDMFLLTAKGPVLLTKFPRRLAP